MTITVYKPTPYKDLYDSANIADSDCEIWERLGWLRTKPQVLPPAPQPSLQSQIEAVERASLPPAKAQVQKARETRAAKAEKVTKDPKDVDLEVEDILSRLDEDSGKKE